MQLEETIEKNLYLIRYCIKKLKYIPETVTYDELFSWGLEGLYRATQNYDKNQNTKFSTYAIFRIRGHILDQIRTEDKLKRKARAYIKVIYSTTEALEQQLLRTPTIKEIAEVLGEDEKEIQTALNKLYFSEDISLDSYIDDTKKTTILDHIATRYTVEDELLIKEAYQELLTHADKVLVKREREFFDLYFIRQYTTQEITEKMNVTYTRVMQLQKQVVSKLRKGKKK